MQFPALSATQASALDTAAINALTTGAPAALNTLDELAAAINDDAGYFTTIINALGLKAALASPTLTGTPAGPTAAAGTNTTQLATTAFVKADRESITDPTVPLILRDDFIVGTTEDGEMGELGWRVNNGTVAAAVSVANHPGVQIFSSTATPTQVCYLSFRKTTGGTEFFLNEVDECVVLFQQAATGNDTDQRIGFSRDPSNATTEWLGLERLAADTNWFLVARNAGVQTRVDTGIAANNTNWLKAKFRREADADWRVSISVNAGAYGAEVAVTTNITAFGVGPLLQMVSSSVARSVNYDFWALRLKAMVR